MIKNCAELNYIIEYDKNVYSQYMFSTRKRRFWAFLKNEPEWLILRWQIISRITDYYTYKLHHSPSLLDKIKYIYYIR